MVCCAVDRMTIAPRVLLMLSRIVFEQQLREEVHQNCYAEQAPAQSRTTPADTVSVVASVNSLAITLASV